MRPDNAGRPASPVFNDWVLNLTCQTVTAPPAVWTSTAPSCQIAFSAWCEPGGSPWFWWTLWTPSPVEKGSPKT